MLVDALRDLWGPGIVFLVLCVWLIRRVVRAARTEAQLERERLRSWMEQQEPARVAAAHELGPHLAPVANETPPRAVLDGTDVRGAAPGHVGAVAAALAERAAADEPAVPEVPWIRSAGAHVAWCERRRPVPPASVMREVIWVAEVRDGKLVQRWQFG
jgi:hypothetical protein